MSEKTANEQIQPTNLSAIRPPEPEKEEEIISRSEEVRAIIERMPTYWAKWVVLCISALMGVIILLGFLIQYPDTVDGYISVTAVTAPVRLVANSNGRINLLQNNKAQLQKGNVISYLESGVSYKHILWIDSVLNMLNASANEELSLPDTLILG